MGCRVNGLSGNYVAHDFALHVGQAKIAASVAVSESFVIEAQQMQHGGVKIVDMERIMDSPIPQVIGPTIANASFDSTPGHPK